MILRVQPPALSPVSLRGLVAGLRAALPRRRAGAPLDAVLRARLNASRVWLLDSGTSALRLALVAASRERLGPIGLPAWGCYDILSAAIGAGIGERLVFYDLDPGTLQPAAESLRGLRELDPAAIVIAHAYGVPVDVPAVRGALGPDPLVIEDAAQGWGGQVQGMPLGAGGDVSTFSFGRGKGITGGRGGALAVLSHRVARIPEGPWDDGPAVAGWRDIGIATALWLLARPRVYGIPAAIPQLRLGETVYRPPREPRGMSRAALAIVGSAIADADQEAAHRRHVAGRLRDIVDHSPLLRNVSLAGGAEPGWLRLPVLARDSATRDQLLADGRPWGIAPGYPRELPAVARERGLPRAVTVSEEGARLLAATLVTLPTHGLLTDGDLAALEAVVSGAA